MTMKNGRPCKRCGTSEWYKSGHCIQCSKNKAAEWKIKNPDKRREIVQKWHQNNRDKELEYKREYNSREDVKRRGREYQRENRESHRGACRRYWERNKNKVTAWIKSYRHRNRERVREWARTSYHASPEKAKERHHARRSSLAKNGGNFTAEEWKALCAQYGNRCLYPGCNRTDLTVDHVVPISKGGGNDISNIQPLCGGHNSSKRDKTIDYRQTKC